VQVAQTARALLHVRLLQAGRRAELLVARRALFHQPVQNPAPVFADDGVVQLARERGEQFAASPQQPRVHQGVARHLVLFRNRQALVQRAATVADREPRVPEQVKNGLAHLRRALGLPAPVQEEQVNVRIRREFLPPVAAERDDGELLRLRLAESLLRADGARHALDEQVNDQAAGRDDRRAADAEAVAQVQPLRLDLEELLERGDALRHCRVLLDAAQLLARVSLDGLEVYLHARPVRGTGGGSAAWECKASATRPRASGAAREALGFIAFRGGGGAAKSGRAERRQTTEL
jgi:hypothetical protein